MKYDWIGKDKIEYNRIGEDKNVNRNSKERTVSLHRRADKKNLQGRKS